MMFFLRNMGFSRFESLLGLTAVAVVVTVALPRMKAGIETEQGQRAEIEARILAETLLEYHHETGDWPHSHDGQADLAELISSEEPTAMATASMLGVLVADPVWLKEVPLDPWNRPYRAFIPAEGSGMILVVSTGPNGTLEADRDQLAIVSQAGRIGTGLVRTGDDIGYLQLASNPTGQP